MKNEKNVLIMIVIMIIIVIICIAVVVGVICMIDKKKNNTENIEKDSEIECLEEGGEEYNTDHLKDFEFEITNLNNSITTKIKDINQFFLDVKQYVYLNGLVQANCAECINIKESENEIIIEFRLNDPKGTIITANINIENDTYIFSDNYKAN